MKSFNWSHSIKGGPEKRNIHKIRAIKKKYKKILIQLHKTGIAQTKVEKRVLNLFKGKSKKDITEAIGNIRFQRGQKDRFIAGVKRSGAYLSQIKSIFRSKGLPEDLAYLPHVESSFNYKAYSKFGAAGIWQFTRSTGRQYMTVDYTVDERRDPIKASYAAARYLKRSHTIFKDWALAITSYNHGVNGLKRAHRKLGTYERIFKEYNGRIFGFASKNFYSEFLAAKAVAKNYKEYFGDIKLHVPVKTQMVRLPGYASLSDLAKHLKISKRDLKTLNPALRSPVQTDQKYVPKTITYDCLTYRKSLLLPKIYQWQFFIKNKNEAATIGFNVGMLRLPSPNEMEFV